MRINQLKAGTLLSYTQMVLNVVIGLAYTPVMIRLLGQSEYGLYNTVASTISMLSVLSLGFNSGYIRYYARYKKDGDTQAISRLNGLFLLIFLVIGLIALACGLYLTEHLELVFKDGLTPQEYGIAHTLMLLLTLNLAISFPMSVFQNIVSAHEQFVFLKLLAMLKTVVGPLLTLPLLLMGHRSVAMITVTVAVSLVVDICYFVFVKFRLKERFSFTHIEMGLLKSLFGFTAFIALNTIIDQINWNIDKVLLGRFKGTAMVAVYAVGFNLYHYYQMVSTAVSGVFTPRIHTIFNRYRENETELRDRFTELFIRVGRIQFLILGLVASGLVFFGQEFIFYWAGPGYDDAYYVALLLVLPASIALIQNVGIEIQRAQNLHKFRAIVYSVMAVINLALSIYLCQLYGAIGSAVGTAISLVIANGLIMNVYYDRKCHINIPLFWKSILSTLWGMAIPVYIGCLIMNFCPRTSFWFFALKILVYTLVYAGSVWMLSMNASEKQLFSGPVRRLLRLRRTNQ
ncbi:MAG: polysaccharide biosynthesis protein [Clostridia bacterium]|nr:polysaccharide biosynthesis protein [Clostridia bacterium]